MKTKYSFLTFICGMGLCASVMAQTNDTISVIDPVQANQTVAATETTQPMELEDTQSKKWNFGVSLYLLAPGMSGDATVKGIPVDVNVDFEKIWDNLHMTGMGSAWVGYGKWTLKADVIYMDLEGEGETKLGPVNVGFEQWMVEPSLSYRFDHWCELLVGARYNNLNAEYKRSGVILNPTRSGTQEWWDPIIGGELNLPFAEKFSINLRGDVGGFGVGSDLTWQAFPYLGWQFTDWGGIQLGYRWLYMDYEDSDEGFAYDVMTQGPQLGISFTF